MNLENIGGGGGGVIFSNEATSENSQPSRD